MTTSSLPRVLRSSRRTALILGLIMILLITGTGVATARWITTITTTTPVTAPTLTTTLTTTAPTTVATTNGYSTPVTLTLHNPNPTTVDHTVSFTSPAGELRADKMTLAVWRPAGPTCPAVAPTTGLTTGTLTTPPTLQVSRISSGATTIVCAATKFDGTVFGSAGHTRTVVPTLTTRLSQGTWSTTADGTAFSHTMAPAPAPLADLHCKNDDGGLFDIFPRGIVLSWAPAFPGATYEIVSSTGEPLPGITNPTTDTTVTLTNQKAGPGNAIGVVVVGPTGKSTPRTHKVDTVRWFWGDLLRCVR